MRNSCNLKRSNCKSTNLTPSVVRWKVLNEPVISWISPRLPIELSNSDVHIWRLNFEKYNFYNLKLGSMLTEEERLRVANFRFKRHGKRFIIGRGVLRILLGLYLNIEPTKLKFRFGLYGKPYLDERFNKQTIQFNLAHSHEFALYVFTIRHRVGVDIEYINKIPDYENIVKHLFSRQENALFEKLPTSQKLRTFFNYWTLKEAYSKACGTGFAEFFNRFDLTQLFEYPTCLFNTKNHAINLSGWSIKSFTPAPDYTAALAIEELNCHPQYFQFVPENSFYLHK